MRHLPGYVLAAVVGLAIGCTPPTAAGSEPVSRHEESEQAPQLDSAELDAIESSASPVQLATVANEPAPQRDPTAAEQYALLYDAERVAAEVYDTFAAKWDGRPFTKIAEAERSHMQGVATLLRRKGAVPPANPETGKYAVIEVQALYDAMVGRGAVSRKAAMDVGAEIEEMSIRDLLAWSEAESDRQAKKILEQLLQGSSNHFKAFLRARKALGMPEYATKYLTIEQAKKYGGTAK